VASQYGTDYSQFLNGQPSEQDPFPQPANEAQRVANARSRAAQAGTPIGSGRLDSKSGVLEDPDGGFMKTIGENPWMGAALALGPAAAFALPALGGAAAGGSAASSTGGVIAGTGIPTVAGTGAGLSAPGGGMGLGSILGWLGKGSDAMTAVGNVGEVLAGAGQGSADQRMSENDQMLRQGLLRQQQSNDQFSNQLRGAEFNRTEQDRQRKAAILSALLGNTQDQSITPGNPLIAARMPQVTGGARPSNLTGNRDALMALLGQSGPQAPTYQAPGMPELDEGGFGEDLMGGVGLTTSLLGALGRGRTTARR
jgi:hypothetical protein